VLSSNDRGGSAPYIGRELVVPSYEGMMAKLDDNYGEKYVSGNQLNII